MPDSQRRQCPATGCQYGRQTGFTMIELMVVVALAAIVLGLGVPSFKGFIVGQRVKAAAFAFANAATYSRSEAIKRNMDVTLVAAVGGWSAGWSVKAGAAVLNQQDGFAGVLMASVAPKVTAIQLVYQSSGRLASAVDELQVSDESGGHARCISFDLSGLPKSRTGTC